MDWKEFYKSTIKVQTSIICISLFNSVWQKSTQKIKPDVFSCRGYLNVFIIMYSDDQEQAQTN